MNTPRTRREFLKTAALAGTSLAALPLRPRAADPAAPIYRISLAQWSLHKTLFAKKLDPMDFAKTARADYGIDAIELVNQFYKDKARDNAFLTDFKKRAADQGVNILLIMCDGEGSLGDPDASARKKAVENHYKWADAARFFGCHSIRVNADSKGAGTFEEQQDRAADGLRKLSEYCGRIELNCIVENHGGLSSDGNWLAGVMKKVGLRNCGTLPDFGNFNLGDGREYDRYRGVAELMPFAKAVSAKSNEFDAQGNEIHTDYRRMMKIVLDAGYRGYVGIEYEGGTVSEPEGIRLTLKLLEKVRSELTPQYASKR